MGVRTSLVLLCLAGCSASLPPQASPPPNAEALDVADATDPAELLRGRSVEEQKRILEFRRWYEAALGSFNKGDFDKARELARKAVQADPENLAARKLLDDIHSVIVGAPARHGVRDRMVGIEQTQIEIAKHLADARRYRGAGMEASARREYEAAELKIRALPYDVPALRDLLPEIRAALAR